MNIIKIANLLKLLKNVLLYKGLNNTSRSNCSTPAREVEENIVCDVDDDDDDIDNIDTFFDSFNKND